MYRNLVSGYPNIRLDSGLTTVAVRVRERVAYGRRGELSRALGLYLAGPHDRPALLVVIVHDGACGHAAVTVTDRVSGQARYPAALDDVKVRCV
jgi:hypothetical protein